MTRTGKVLPGGKTYTPEAAQREADANARVLAPAATAFAMLLARIYVAQEMTEMKEPVPVPPTVSPAADEGAEADFRDAESQRALTEVARALARELGKQAAQDCFAQQAGKQEPR